MKSFRYNTSGTWYKGNTHVHSIVSDGGKNFRELGELYSSEGYDFLFRTDHRIPSDTAKDTEKYPLLWLDGIELDGYDGSGAFYHVVCLGHLNGINPELDFEASLRTARDQGAFIILAHPHWSGNSFDDCLHLQPDGVEIYNHHCRWLNGKSDGMAFWEALLREWPGMPAFAVDDSHISEAHPCWNGGWIMVNAPECTSSEIFKAIRRGNFYASCGPEFHSLVLEDNTIHVTTSPVKYLRLAGPDYNGIRMGSFDDKPITSTQITVPPDWEYVYLEVEDHKGNRAWSNPLFTRC
jgi:hypothetical protein